MSSTQADKLLKTLAVVKKNGAVDFELSFFVCKKHDYNGFFCVVGNILVSICWDIRGGRNLGKHVHTHTHPHTHMHVKSCV